MHRFSENILCYSSYLGQIGDKGTQIDPEVLSRKSKQINFLGKIKNIRNINVVFDGEWSFCLGTTLLETRLYKVSTEYEHF